MRFLRPLAAVVAAYAVMAVVVMALFGLLAVSLGVDRMFAPGGFRSSRTVIVFATLFSIVGAALAGWVCARIARARGPVIALAAIVVALGILHAAGNAAKPDPGPRPAGLTVFEAASRAKEPDAFAFSMPFVGGVGVLAGGAGVVLGSARRTRSPGS
ncbi:MAG: hypothetical protein AB7Q17_03735 [Phycisphaerae bacterium]